jgi:sulfur carrier protein ThiS adenylyltransferase
MRTILRNRLRTRTVGIAGAGGLGSNAAAALVRAGVGRLVIADFDVVQESNLDRQFYFFDQVGKPKVDALAENLRRIDPSCSVEVHAVRLDPDGTERIFRDCDLVIEAFDAAEAKAMLLTTFLTRFPEKPLVAASGLAGWGRTDDMAVLRLKNLTVVGDQRTEVSPNMPPLAPRVFIAAGMEANEALEILLGPMPKETKPT